MKPRAGTAPDPRAKPGATSAVVFLGLTAWVSLSLMGCATTLYDRSYDDSHPPLYLSPVLGMEPELSKIEAKRVSPDSPAASAGFKKGDEIISIEGENLYRSSRRLYASLLDFHEKKTEVLKVNVKRGAQDIDLYIRPNYDPSKTMLGLKLKLTLPDGKELKSVQFMREEVSEDGFLHSTFFDFRDHVRIAVHSHLWGKDLLVVEFSIFNNYRKKSIKVDPQNFIVRNNWGSVLQPLGTESILHKMYDIETLHAILDDPEQHHKDQAIEVSSEINELRKELTANELKLSEILPHAPTYGALIYLFDAKQSPISMDAQIAEEKFTARFELNQETSQTSSENTGKNYWFGA